MKFKMDSQREIRRVEGVVMNWGTEKEHRKKKTKEKNGQRPHT